MAGECTGCEEEGREEEADPEGSIPEARDDGAPREGELRVSVCSRKNTD